MVALRYLAAMPVGASFNIVALVNPVEETAASESGEGVAPAETTESPAQATIVANNSEPLGLTSPFLAFAFTIFMSSLMVWSLLRRQRNV